MELKSEFIYCSNRDCPKIECMRHNKNIPFGILYLRENYKLDKKDQCEMYVD